MLTPIALDFETSCNGHGSTEYYKDGFKVDSIALTWSQDGSLKSVFYDDPRVIRKALERLDKTQRPVIVHNYQFEYGVMLNCYPDLNLNFMYDTMRMCFLRDGDGQPKRKSNNELEKFLDTHIKTKVGLGLEKCALRYLTSEYHNHKEEAHTWIRENCNVSKGFGKYLDKLPRDILERYNIADTEITYRLWEDCTRFFKHIGYRDRIDWQYYKLKKELEAKSRSNGFVIDREGLLEYITTQEQRIQDMYQELLDFIGQDTLDKFEQIQINKRVSKLKTDKGKEKARKRLKEQGVCKFNPNSGPQFAEIMLKFFDIKAEKFTKGGKPSTAVDDLWQWGDAGKIIERKGKMNHALNQAIGIYLASEKDNKWHPDIKPGTTATNRTQGGSESA